MAHSQAVKLANCLQEQAELIYSFLENVLTGTEESNLILAGLQTLKYFIKWINPSQIVETQVFEALCSSFLPQPDYTEEVLDLFYEIFDSPQLPEEFSTIINQVFNMMVQAVNSYITSQQPFDFNSNLHFSQILPMTLTVFLEKFGRFLETPENLEQIQVVLQWLLELMNVDDYDILQTCCNFWLVISRRCHQEQKTNQNQQTALTEIYAPALPHVRRSLIEKMQRPDDIIIVEDETGNLIREHRRNTQTLMIYSLMKECLVLLTSIDPDDTISAIQTNIDILSNDWSPDIYDRVCWSVGAISRVLDFDREKTFITQLIRIQLDMSQRCPDPNDRARIASGIMHICSQYPRFLQKFPNFLRTVVMKLFDFMHQTDVQGVQEMAVESFKKITTGCKRQFGLKPPDSNDPPFIVEIISNYPSIIADLEPAFRIIFFEALSIVISNSRRAEATEQLDQLLGPLNEQWSECMDNFNPSNMDIVDHIAYILGCNAAIALNMKQLFHNQFMSIFPQMMMVYSSLGSYENETIAAGQITQEANKLILKAKSSIVEVIKNFVLKTQNPESTIPEIIPELAETVFPEYGSSDPMARTPEVLNLLSILFKQMQAPVNEYLSPILEAIFTPTVDMIREDFISNTTFRLPFYQLLEELVKYYLPNLISMPEGFDQVILTIQWGYKHPTHEVCDKSLDILLLLFKKVRDDTNEQIYQDFLQNYYTGFITDMFSILTDTIHKFAIDKNILILIELLKNTEVTLDPEAIAESIFPFFVNRDPQLVLQFVTELIRTSTNNIQFKDIIKNFLVTTRQYLPKDPDLLKEENAERDIENQNYLNENVYIPEQEDENDFLS